VNVRLPESRVDGAGRAVALLQEFNCKMQIAKCRSAIEVLNDQFAIFDLQFAI
jgi:hypothetical protein